MRFYTSEQIGRTRSLTPEGFMLCEHVPIARVGTLLYAAGEVPVDAGPDRVIRIHREPEEVFKPSAVLSFSGKPVTNDHPPEKVSPDNFQDYSTGVVLNPHRGDGLQEDNDFLYVDLLVQRRDAIQEILDGKLEVSAGYEADYEQIRPGEGRQFNIIGNHVALVRKGRCGTRCAIGDRAMAVRPRARATVKDRLLEAFRTNDEAKLVEEAEKIEGMLGDIVSDNAGVGDGGEGHHISINLNGMGHAAGGAGIRPAPMHDEDPADDLDEPNGGPGGGENGAPPWAQQLMQRVERIENAIVVLAHAEHAEVEGEGEGGDPDDMGEDEPGDGEETGDDESEMGEGEGDWNYGDPGDVERESSRTGDARRRTRDTSHSLHRGRRMPMATDRRSGGTRDNGARATGTRDSAMTMDSGRLRETFAGVMSRAELLVPGIRLPTFDAKAPAATTYDALCGFRRHVLRQAWRQQDTHDVIASMAIDELPNFDRMTCDEATVLFNGASEAMRGRTIHVNGAGYAGARQFSQPTTPADINKANAEFYGKK